MPFSDEEVIGILREDSPRNRARKLIASHAAQVEQAFGQLRPPRSVDVRRWEIETVEAILREFGVEITVDKTVDSA